MNLEELSYREKIELLEQLLKDKDLETFYDAELIDKVEQALLKVYKKIEELLLQKDEAHHRVYYNMWRTHWDTQYCKGVSETCAEIKAELDKIIETPFNEYEYSVLNDIHHQKNKLINNSFSNALKGTRAYNTILKYEGQLADIFEHGWKSAFNLGKSFSYHLTNEQLENIEENKLNIADKLSRGSYSNINLCSLLSDNVETNDNLLNMIPLNPSEHPKVMEFLKNYFK